ncbi:iron uptake porin [Synechococcus sp. RS9916]|uniref:iron uptake porin n=1 Tax=Synechococcus sp. RS9916 TaxID=221359 RepID=UPI0000E540B4|nr:iron uptake porin [Synechococcus sp. RS9916]EAU73560.1 possible porin [Synechococcus sp. RS9916]
MKLFQQLLVAPAALGLLAPLAVDANRSANAAELNINGVSDYAASSLGSSLEQVTSISQFSDVYPTDWAYQALSNLIERYGCVAGYPNGTYRGNRAMTRYEAAALLNACLDRITEVTDELKRLMKEFEKELAILKGRVDGLEARVGELEATQFSTTTKMSGKADFVIGATSYGGDKTDDLYATDEDGKRTGYLGDDALSFSYRYTLNLNTSFTGKDLLYTRLRTGNFNANAFSGKGYTGKQSQLETSKSSADILKVDKLWYEFPVGNFRVYAGPKIENYYMLGASPSVYRHILKQFKLGGYYGAYGASTSPGFGVNWISDRYANYGDAKLKLSANYVSKNGANSNAREGGFMTDNGKGKFLSQIAYGNTQWQVAAAYAYSQRGMTVGGAGTPLGASTKNYEEANQVNLNAYWRPQDNGWIPSISVGWSLSSFNLPKETIKGEFNGTRTEAQGWLVGLNWKDAFMKGNRLGFAAGSPQFVTAIKGEVTKKDGTKTKYPDDGNMAFELYYDFQVTDNVTITPAVFYLSRPFGQKTGSSAETGGLGADQFNTFGGLVQTTFKF